MLLINADGYKSHAMFNVSLKSYLDYFFILFT